MKNAFYTMMAIIALLFAGTTVKAADKVDAKAEFKQEQDVCIDNFINAWLEEKSEKELAVLCANLARANSRYRMTCGGLDNSLAGMMIRAMENGKTVKDQLNLAACEYFHAKGINLGVRDIFTRGSFKVRN